MKINKVARRQSVWFNIDKRKKDMKLQKLAKSPELSLVVLDDQDTIKEFSEPLEFYTYDRIPLDTFTKLAGDDQHNIKEMISLVKGLILDDTGKEIISENNMLPPNVLIKAIAKIVSKLGN
jgi:hypothetical protein